MYSKLYLCRLSLCQIKYIIFKRDLFKNRSISVYLNVLAVLGIIIKRDYIVLNFFLTMIK